MKMLEGQLFNVIPGLTRNPLRAVTLEWSYAERCLRIVTLECRWHDRVHFQSTCVISKKRTVCAFRLLPVQPMGICCRRDCCLMDHTIFPIYRPYIPSYQEVLDSIRLHLEEPNHSSLLHPPPEGLQCPRRAFDKLS